MINKLGTVYREIKMDLSKIIDMWDNQADDWNSWDTLDCDERCEWIAGVYQKIIDKINNWINAYPLDIFPEPDFEKAHEVLKSHGMTLDSISASNFRHVLKGVKEIIGD